MRNGTPGRMVGTRPPTTLGASYKCYLDGVGWLPGVPGILVHFGRGPGRGVFPLAQLQLVRVRVAL